VRPAVEALIGLLSVLGAGLLLTAAVAMFRARDALSRINVFSPATGLGLPMIVLAGYLHKLLTTGFAVLGLLQLFATMLALLMVSSVATNVLARATYLGGAPVDPRTDPHDLARDPDAAASRCDPGRPE